jgi:hypothetical protein
MKIKALPGKILAIMVDKPDGFRKTSGGIIMQDKDATSGAIRPRWFKIYTLGADIDIVKEGDYVLVAHGRWSNGVKIDDLEDKLFQLDNEELLMVSDECPPELMDNA